MGKRKAEDDSNNVDGSDDKKSRKSTSSSTPSGGSAAKTAKTYEERVRAVNSISEPLASKKSTKKLHKLVKKASSIKHIRRGVKEVVKGIRKGERGLAILAGDIYPMDVVSHLPILMEENDIPYLFVPSKQDLGAAANTKRPTSCVLVRTPKKDFEGQDIYDSMMKEAKEYNPTGL